MRTCIVFVLLACTAASAQLNVTVNPLGGVDRMTLGERVIAQAVQVRIVKPGWNGAWGAQAPGGGLTVAETAEGDVRVFRGSFECGGKPCAFEQRLMREGDIIKLTYKLIPSADLETELVVVTVDFPTEGNAGAGSFHICDGQAIAQYPLPALLPDPYHIAGAGDIAWCGWLLPGDAGLRVEPDGIGITGVSFQDNRQFRGDVFEAQFAVRDTKGLKAGQTYEFGLTLRPLTAALLVAENKQIVDLAKSMETPMTSRQPLALRGLKLSATEVPAFERLEVDLDLSASFDNPFDPRDIDVTATFTGPGGRVMRVPGFYYQDFEWVTVTKQRRLKLVGEPQWKVRFAPPQPGRWQVTVTARDRTGEVTSEPLVFECVAGNDKGYVRRVPDNPYYLQFDNGDPYFAVGENICWGAPEKYEEWFNALGAAGGNYCRIWLVRWNMGLEWSPGKGSGHYHGVGKYSLDNAYRLDWVMEQARKRGIYCMLCLGYHGELMDTRGYFGEDCWGENPYNVVNGGPCAKPADFWTNEDARRLYRQRLRYYIARYGWSTNVLSWELWNEVTAPAPWVSEMARYFKANDPYGHLVTTTYGYDEVWRLPEIDYTQAHTYGSDEDRPQTVPALAALGKEYTAKWPKPYMTGEFGIDWKTGDDRHDPQGLGTSLHEGLWASVMTRCFGAAAIWYWDGYVHPKNLYREFSALRRFVDTVPWPKLKLQEAEFGQIQAPVPADTPWGEVRLQGGIAWGKATGQDFALRPDGSLAGEGAFCRVLYSDSKKDLKTPLRFHVNLHRDGKLVLHVDTVSSKAVLHVRLDGNEVWQHEFLTGPGEGEWKSTQFREQWGIWQSQYDKDYEIPIPAGEHVVEIENTGSDWVSVASYTFTECRDPRFATLDQLGLRTDDFAVIWLHDQESNWYNDKQGKQPREMAGVSTELLGLRDGRYAIEWWDTRKGEVIGATEATSEGGRLPIAAPPFVRDIAAKVTYQG